MQKFTIKLIPGDGIGIDVINEAVRVLQRLSELHGGVKFDFQPLPWSCEYYLKTGCMMPKDGLQILADCDSILLGAVGFPGVPDHISLRELLLPIRVGFDQYVNLRPVKLLPGLSSPLKNEAIDFVVIRENSEGEYSGMGDWLFRGKENEVVLQTGVFSRKGVERIIRYAYEMAHRENKTLTSVSKSNALNYSMVFWDQVFAEVGKEYPDVKTQVVNVDAAALFFVKQPQKFQVVVTSNLFGDILTDLGAAIAGGMGLAAGANLNPERTFPSMFEPIHGSAPDIMGKGIANPLASVWSASQMLDFFGYEEWGAKVLGAVEDLMVDGSVLSPDMGGTATTREVGDAVVRRLEAMA